MSRLNSEEKRRISTYIVSENLFYLIQANIIHQEPKENKEVIIEINVYISIQFIIDTELLNNKEHLKLTVIQQE